MRIPADPEDPDLVLADCKRLLRHVCGVPACGERHVDVDVALLRSAESDLRHVVEANPPGYRERSLESALRSLQAFMRANGVARNVGGVLVSDPPTAGGVQEVPRG